MSEQPNSRYYSVEGHTFVLTYLNLYPETCRRVAVELGYHDPPLGVELNAAPSVKEWYEDLIYQYWLAAQPGGKRSGSPDARIWLSGSFLQAETIDILVDLIQARIRQEREAMV
jgi:hypothetical protein